MPDPVAFTIGSVAIRWYGVMAALAFLAGYAVVFAKRKYPFMTKGDVSDLVFVMVISGILGSRLFYVVQFWEYYRGDFWRVFKINEGGLVFYGGFICAVICIAIFAARRKLSIPRVMDICVPGLAMAHAVSRVGCFLNGCCYGKPTTMPWGVAYPAGSLPAEKYAGIALHPVQLYETMGNLAIFGLLFYFAGRLKTGMNFSLYFILYGLFCFVDEFFRGDHADFVFNLFTPAQSIGTLMVPVGVALFVFFWKREDHAGKQQDS